MVHNAHCGSAPSCGTTCGKLLPCGVHTCNRPCHAGSCTTLSIPAAFPPSTAAMWTFSRGRSGGGGGEGREGGSGGMVELVFTFFCLLLAISSPSSLSPSQPVPQRRFRRATAGLSLDEPSGSSSFECHIDAGKQPVFLPAAMWAHATALQASLFGTLPRRSGMDANTQQPYAVSQNLLLPFPVPHLPSLLCNRAHPRAIHQTRRARTRRATTPSCCAAPVEAGALRRPA